MTYPDYITVNGHLMSHPLKMEDKDWHDDLRIWPRTEAPQVVSYLVETKACDLKEMKAYRSLESYNYLHNGWVGQVLIHEVKDGMCLLKCGVTPSQNLSNSSHTAWVCANTSGEILTAGCSCMAGLGKVCSHVGAVLWKLDLANRLGLVGQSCTDKNADWNRGTKRNLEPALLKDISFKKPKATDGTKVNNLKKSGFSKNHDTDQFYSHKEVLQHLQENGLQELLSIPGTIFHSIGKVKVADKQSEIPLIAPVILVHDHSLPNNLPGSCKPCSDFYNKYIKINSQQQIVLKNSTVSQACTKKPLWQDSRRIRLTASTSSSVPKRANTSPECYLKTKLYKQFKGDENTAYGIEMESVARDKFVEITGLNVEICGTVISDDDNWLSASPDGVIGSTHILEIKCPRPEKFDLKKVDLVHENGQLQLNSKGQRGYFTQVQIAMHCTKSRSCFFLSTWVEMATTF